MDNDSTGTALSAFGSATGETSVLTTFQVSGTDSGQVSRYDWTTPHVEGQFAGAKGENQISAGLYFRYVKKKLNLIESRKFKARLSRLEKMSDEFEKMGQIAMSEECIKQFLIVMRESAMWACGIKLYIEKKQAEKFRHSVKHEKLCITPMENYGRVIPPTVAKKIKYAMKKKLFDEYVIFHLDNKDWRKGSSVVETQKQKIEREKDPIAFGKINETDRYYFIADWEDELDNLRLKDIVETLALKRENMTIKQHVDLDAIKKAMK
jgi:hypothetical protein